MLMRHYAAIMITRAATERYADDCRCFCCYAAVRGAMRAGDARADDMMRFSLARSARMARDVARRALCVRFISARGAQRKRYD